MSAAAAGKTLQQIADQLAAAGTPTPRGGQWHRSTIHKLLQSARLDERAAADQTRPETGPAPTVRLPPAGQAERAVDLDGKLPTATTSRPHPQRRSRPTRSPSAPEPHIARTCPVRSPVGWTLGSFAEGR